VCSLQSTRPYLKTTADADPVKNRNRPSILSDPTTALRREAIPKIVRLPSAGRWFRLISSRAREEWVIAVKNEPLLRRCYSSGTLYRLQ
jgi:hypothetical protein